MDSNEIKERPCVEENGLLSYLSLCEGVPFKSTKDLINWIYDGELPKEEKPKKTVYGE